MYIEVAKSTWICKTCKHDNIKSCVVYNNCKSDIFWCEKGVRQGENLSVLRFTILAYRFIMSCM